MPKKRHTMPHNRYNRNGFANAVNDSAKSNTCDNKDQQKETNFIGNMCIRYGYGFALFIQLNIPVPAVLSVETIKVTNGNLSAKLNKRSNVQNNNNNNHIQKNPPIDLSQNTQK